MRSLADSQEFAHTLLPVARTATATGSSVDTGSDSDARTVLFDIGLWTDGTHEFTFERKTEEAAGFTEMVAAEFNDKDGVLETVGDGNSVIVLDGSNDNDFFQIDLLTTDEIIRVVQTVTGGPVTGLVSAVVIQNGHPLRVAGGSANPGDAAGLLA